MGSVVNMAARLMSAAGDGVLVDAATMEASSVAVRPRPRDRTVEITAGL